MTRPHHDPPAPVSYAARVTDHGRVRKTMALIPVLLLSACGSADRVVAEGTPESRDPRPVVLVAGEVQVGCGDATEGWSASVMADGLPDVVTQEEVSAAFRQFLADPQLSEELGLTFLANGANGTEWRVLYASGDYLTLGLGPWTADGPGPGARTFSMEREGDGWRWLGGGDCQPAPLVRPGSTWASVAQEPAGLDPTATSLPVLVSERQCTSARDPATYLHEPVVVETDESVTVYWTSTPAEGAQDCPGNPWVPRTLELAEPLGERVLLDGSRWPARPVEPVAVP